MSVRYTYLNGKILPHNKAYVGVDDIAISRGFGVYDGIETYGGKPFELARHYKRFSNSAKLLGIRVPVSEKELGAILDKLIKKNPFKQPLARVLLTGGMTIGGIEFNQKTPTFIIMLEETPILPAKYYSDGVRVITHEYQRQFPGAKTINYITAVLQRSALKKAKAVEVIYTSGGKALEASTCNLFIVKKGKLITPKEGILNGITRQITILCAKNAYKVEERAVTVKELMSADEVFLTSSFKEILPVSHIDGKVIGKPGPVTKDLIQRFKDYVRKSAS